MDVRDTIEKRRTLKVLADPDLPWELPDPSIRNQIEEVLSIANNAPFHKPVERIHRDDPMSSPVPWRFHVIDANNCRNLSRRIAQADLQAGKIRHMLAAANAVVMSTWLPNKSEDSIEFQQYAPTLQNMEHIAAASAAIQNLLLMATKAGFNSYWSSGGVLRSELVFDWTGIALNQILLGAIFLFPEETRGVDVKPGGMRERKGPASQWSRWVELD